MEQLVPGTGAAILQVIDATLVSEVSSHLANIILAKVPYLKSNLDS
jgi:hypothetical protein